ncbi:MAG: hypothetical protein IKI68_03085 [Clostridia bacterium]|nr:hypothetical protein [Clostridia bacterium]
MYYCTDCKNFFSAPLKLKETDHAFGEHFETSHLCPYCKSSYIKRIETEYCRCCGRKLKSGQHIYCSRACMKNGDRLYILQRERKKRIMNSPVYVIVRKLKEYNEKHNTNLSYGQFVAGVYG